VKILAVILCSLLAGCVSRREVIVVPPIHVTVDTVAPRPPSGGNPVVAVLMKSAFGPDTAVGQMAVGCVRYYERNQRWPHTKDEVAVGMSSVNLSPAKLVHFEELTLRESGAALVINFTSTENGRVQGTITLGPPNA